MSVDKADLFLHNVENAEIQVIDGMIRAMMPNESQPARSWESILGSDNLDISNGWTEDLPDITTMDTGTFAPIVTPVRDTNEACRVRRDLEISGRSRISRFIGGLYIVEARRKDLAYDVGIIGK